MGTSSPKLRMHRANLLRRAEAHSHSMKTDVLTFLKGHGLTIQFHLIHRPRALHDNAVLAVHDVPEFEAILADAHGTPVKVGNDPKVSGGGDDMAEALQVLVDFLNSAFPIDIRTAGPSPRRMRLAHELDPSKALTLLRSKAARRKGLAPGE